MALDIPQQDVKAGDLFKFLGRTHRIVGFEPYTGPHDFVARILVTDLGMKMSMCHGDWFDVERAVAS